MLDKDIAHIWKNRKRKKFKMIDLLKKNKKAILENIIRELTNEADKSAMNAFQNRGCENSTLDIRGGIVIKTDACFN